MTEFWRRWHITLSRWLRDYIYISLGGNRRGALRTYLQLLLTMLLGGLWHGASWNFVIWGGYHGVLLAIERMVWGRREQTGLLRIPLAIVTFLLVCVGWVFFRAKTLASAVFVVGQMFSRIPGALVAHSVAMASGDSVAGGCAGGGISRAAFAAHIFARVGANCGGDVALLAIELFSATDQTIPFVYFQF